MTASRQSLRSLRVFAATIALATALGGQAHAATFDVSNGNATGAGSFQQAIDDAIAAGGTGHIITISLSPNATLTLNNMFVIPTQVAQIDGSNTTNLTITANGSEGIFQVSSIGGGAQALTINNLSLSGGNALGANGTNGTGSGGGGGGAAGLGGALRVMDNATVTLTDVGFTNNLANGGQGAQGGAGASSGAGGNGGGGTAGGGNTVNGSNGDFGEGGGGGGGSANGGSGGFGGGGGGTGSNLPFRAGGAGGSEGGGGGYGVSGGSSGGGGGGGGAGLGGAVFVQDTATLILNNVSFSGNAVAGGNGGAAGSGAGGGGNGRAVGEALYLRSDATFSGGSVDDSIGGAGGVIINGATSNTTTSFTNANTYLGNTQINNGILSISDDDQLGGAGSDLVFDGGVLEVTGTSDSFRDIVINDNGPGGFIEVRAGEIYSINGVLSGAGSLYKSGGGTLTLTDTNTTNTGATTITGGVLAIAAGTSIGSDMLIFNGGSMNVTDDTELEQDIFMGATGAMDIDTHDVELSGDITGSGNFNKLGAGTMTLSGDNSAATGELQISGGTLVATNANNFMGTNLMISNGAALQTGADMTVTQDLLVNGGGGTISTDANTTATFSGDITGDTLTKDGTGTLVLTGTGNTYTDTSINGGTLRIASQANLGAGDVIFEGGTLSFSDSGTLNRSLVLSSGGNLQVDSGKSLNFTGTTSGNTALNKMGEGTLNITNTLGHTGDTRVYEGTLAINAMATTSVFQTYGGTLKGTGTLAGLVANSGTVAPGNSIGELKVYGPVTFNAGSVYQVEVSPTASDKITSTGTVTINGGTVSVLAANGDYGTLKTYDIITGSAVTGNFTSASDDLAFYTASTTNTGTAIRLDLTRNQIAFDDVAKDQPQRDTASAINDLQAGNPVYDAYSNVSDDDATNALDRLSGEHISGVSQAAAATTSAVKSQLVSRLQNLSAITASNFTVLAANNPDPSMYVSALMEPSAKADNRGYMWMQALASSGTSKAQGTAPKQNRNSAGTLVGFDAAIGDNSVIGVFGGWETGDVKTKSENAKSNIDNWHAGIYGAHSLKNGLRLSGGFVGTYHDIDTSRALGLGLGTASGDTDGRTLMGFTELAAPIKLNETVVVEPFIGANLTYSHMDGYTESGVGGLVVEDTSNTTPGTQLGVRGTKVIATENRDITLRGSLAWEHNYGDLENRSTMRFSSGTTSFNTYGPDNVRDAGLVGAGAETDIGSSGAKLYGDYNGRFASDDRDHSVSVGFKLPF